MKKTTKKKRTTTKRKTTPRTKPHFYREPKTAAELGITCLAATGAGEKCGQPAFWFDYELGEKEFYSGFVCDEHRVSNRVEKLAQPSVASVV
jgi:hypothetical protein